MKKYLFLIVLTILTACGQSDSLGIDQHGVPVSEALLADQWLVINYWAVWCAPCRNEIPELNALHHRLSDKGVRVFGVNYDQLQGEALQADSQRLGIAFPVLAKDPAQRFALPTVHGLPVSYIVNPEGVWVRTLEGEQTLDSILQVLSDEGWSAP